MNTESNPLGFTPMPPLLKAEDVAELLNISLAYAYRLTQSGQIPTVRLGRAVRIRYQDLLTFIERSVHCQMDNL